MDEKYRKLLEMDFIKRERLVLEIVGTELATIRNEKEVDEEVYNRVMLVVNVAIIVGGIFIVLAVVLGLTLPPYDSGDGETSYPASGPAFGASAAFLIAVFCCILSSHVRYQHTAIVVDKAKGTFQFQHWSGIPMSKPKEEILVDIVRIEARIETVKNSDGPNYDATRIYAVDKNDQLTRLYSYTDARPPEDIVLHFNAWLHGEEAGPAAYRVLL
jgi:hypothetical protein